MDPKTKPFLYVALDFADQSKGLAFARNLRETCPEAPFGFKVNLDTVLDFAASALSPYQYIQNLQKLDKPIFVDLKMWNGARTMSHIAQGCADLGVELINLYPHTGGKFIQKVVKNLEGTMTKLLSLTVLTHYTDSDTDLLYGKTIEQSVALLARIGLENGAHGIIAPVPYLPAIRHLGGLRLSPGIRPLWHEDQKDNFQEQTATPKEAVVNGADYIVVGSPILKAKDPAVAVRTILQEMEA